MREGATRLAYTKMSMCAVFKRTCHLTEKIGPWRLFSFPCCLLPILSNPLNVICERRSWLSIINWTQQLLWHPRQLSNVLTFLRYGGTHLAYTKMSKCDVFKWTCRLKEAIRIGAIFLSLSPSFNAKESHCTVLNVIRGSPSCPLHWLNTRSHAFWMRYTTHSLQCGGLAGRHAQYVWFMVVVRILIILLPHMWG